MDASRGGALTETFVIRVAVTERPEERDAADVLRGSVEHVRGGEPVPFASPEQLISIIRRAIGGPVGGAGSREKREADRPE
jgi:hypothetical protein